MAVQTLTPFSTVALALNTPTQLTVPGGGNCYYTIINLGTGNLYVSKLNTVGANATSMKIPANQPMLSLPVYGPTGLWVSADVAGSVSVAVLPRA